MNDCTFRYQADNGTLYEQRACDNCRELYYAPSWHPSRTFHQRLCDECYHAALVLVDTLHPAGQP